MISFPLAPKIIQRGKNKTVFEVEALYPGYGVTVGNSLRRVLLTSLPGVAVTEARIKGSSHEFSAMPGILEDMIMVTLNLKKLRFKIFEGESQKVSLKVKGEREVKGSDFEKSPLIELANPEMHIATITDKKTEFEVEITIEKGIGYEPKDQRKGKKMDIGTIALDAIYTPIKNVNFQVENMRVGDRTDFDKLSIEIETDGTMTPEEAFFDACEILLKHFNIILGSKKPQDARISLQNSEDVKEVLEDSDVNKTAVEDLKFSTRTINALTANSIKTVGGIMKKSEKSLSELEGMGEKAITEIKKKLKKLGLELKAE
ncbi:MAG: DNA-directed RNA polymerase subunit alpha [Candidatus Staskawiczbacteria bacterium RIFOXYB2_FULL_32_9]|uniref:DNA-directed RNA polymerase subunit alpha n=1 Tax=Candidatus Staskawiczbacteria bacterium RIFOXYD1_FULL_32_13 TaxID=1802234 RepID=A0A1G2JNU9_9BACT|nr:MAG: DNA-directed RNA polymerase subunit alpha [Parcubacteria group bacterium GW2011_GWC2_32_10]OGZ79671.1 MAG: DNA-directed RNA polymerase subunit alpha [Candidatus Staskawiczbacteria bacterium RIFOXYB1_FULL_32_11]OGZ81079.1 MAG: DNA-directed RNA polymerase subunit alpha [Candidatus Staskawiczbacteria bacterium RIFOXYA2_FULL_32_7]OGZ81139.1 MAG: DNA-directed RNA polymerase subunit alpha [Candidatus Staskawiczbacteria bacterium RIFOXYB2_FULL_32_9]OGZ85501.1 MAG: DNA-directed RNA polymerase s